MFRAFLAASVITVLLAGSCAAQSSSPDCVQNSVDSLDELVSFVIDILVEDYVATHSHVGPLDLFLYLLDVEGQILDLSRRFCTSSPNLSGVTPTQSTGSEPMATAPLDNGAGIQALVSGDTSLTISLLGSTSGTPQTIGQYTVGPGAAHVISGDFNGDGKADLAVSNFGNLSTSTGGNIQILLGKGDGTFTPGATVNVGQTPVSLVAADFNGEDGKLDIAVANVSQNIVSVVLGNGNGTFQAPQSFQVAPLTTNCLNSGACVPRSLVAVDVNGDGRTDLVVALNAATVVVLLGNGDGTFQAAVPYPAGSGAVTYLASIDLNGDGTPDLVAAIQGSNAFSFLFGNGDGSFQPPVEYVTGARPGYFALAKTNNGPLLITIDGITGNLNMMGVSPGGIAATPQLYILPHAATSVAAADLNRDHLPDMVAADGAISVLLRNAGGGFRNPVNYALQSGSQAVAVAVGDLNGDGINDVVAASSLDLGTTGGTVDVALGNGDGTLGRQNSYNLGGWPGGTLGAAPSGILTGDFNGDGKLDVAAGIQSFPGDLTSGGVSVFLGNGDGTLRTPVNYPAGGLSTLSMVAGDFNGDGKLDIVSGVGGASYSYSTPGAIAVMLGKGDGTFQPALLTQVGSPAGTPIAIAAGDLNGDGKLDLVASVWDANLNDTIVVLLGNGDGTFRQLAPFTTPAAGQAIAIIDFNGDGKPDLVVGDCCGLSESVYLLGNGDGTFQAVQYFTSGASVTGFAATSWNNDGIAGLAIASQNGTVMALNSALKAQQSPNSVTIQTSPSGLQFSVDGGAAQTAPQTLSLPAGSHTIAVAATQPGAAGTQYVFANWSDGGAASHQITIGNSAATYTASFNTQYQLTISASPAAGGGFSPATGTFYNSGTVVPVSATPDSGYSFTGWTGNVASTSSAATTITMSSPQSVTANFSSGTASGGLLFYPVAPCRIADTRGNGFTGAFGPPSIQAGFNRSFPVQQSNCNIPTSALAYSLNVTVAPPGGLTYLTLWPAGQSQPTVSTLNDFSTQLATPGNVAANAAIVPAGTSGSVSVFVSNTSDVIIDINGYFAPPGAGGLAFYPMTPCRVADTRGNGKTGLFGPPSLAGGTSRSFPIPQSSCNVPASSQAYSLNITAVPPGQLIYLTTWPAGQAQPLVSTLNDFSTQNGTLDMGRVVANAAVVPAGMGGAVSVYVSDASDLVVDVNGYFAPPGAPGALSFYAVPPCRIADTRGNGFTGVFGPPSMAAATIRSFPIPQQSSCAVPATAQAYSLNFTVVPPNQLTYLTTWPAGQSQPVVSTLNDFSNGTIVPGRVVANAAIVPAGVGGSLNVFVSDPTDVIIDINGYFAP